jgi:Suppressor of fused protein (SUFU)
MSATSLDSRLAVDSKAAHITHDPQLPDPISSPNGSFTLLQIVGITAQELAHMKATSTSAVLNELSTANPLLVTDPARAPADIDPS